MCVKEKATSRSIQMGVYVVAVVVVVVVVCKIILHHPYTFVVFVDGDDDVRLLRLVLALRPVSLLHPLSLAFFFSFFFFGSDV